MNRTPAGPDTSGRTPDPVQKAESALKALREAKDPDAQRRDTDRLERALEKLKRQRPPSDPARREEQRRAGWRPLEQASEGAPSQGVLPPHLSSAGQTGDQDTHRPCKRAPLPSPAVPRRAKLWLLWLLLELLQGGD
jgi:hypothetical protein